VRKRIWRCSSEGLTTLVQPLGDPGRDLGFDGLQIRAGRRGASEHELVGLLTIRVIPARRTQSRPFTFTERDRHGQRGVLVAVRRRAEGTTFG
jgi:hypothetical protein